MEEKILIENTPTSELPDMLKEQIKTAHEKKDLSELVRLTGFPVDVIVGKRIMTRKERRAWYHENRRRLRLPKWSELDTLETKK